MFSSLTNNYVFQVELIMIGAIVLLTAFIFYKLGIFRTSK
jgi:hypothetical protein